MTDTEEFVRNIGPKVVSSLVQHANLSAHSLYKWLSIIADRQKNITDGLIAFMRGGTPQFKHFLLCTFEELAPNSNMENICQGVKKVIFFSCKEHASNAVPYSWDGDIVSDNGDIHQVTYTWLSKSYDIYVDHRDKRLWLTIYRRTSPNGFGYNSADYQDFPSFDTPLDPNRRRRGRGTGSSMPDHIEALCLSLDRRLKMLEDKYRV